MFQEYSSLSDEELDEKMEELMKKIQAAHAMNLDGVVEQMQDILEMMQLELRERTEKFRFDIITERTPDSLVIGEDNGSDASTDDD